MAPDPRDPVSSPSEATYRALARDEARRHREAAADKTRRFIFLMAGLLAAPIVLWATAMLLVRRIFLGAAVASCLLLAGCGSDPVREEKIRVVLEEIALLGSMAQTEGTRYPGHIEQINVDTRKVQAHVMELVK